MNGWQRGLTEAGVDDPGLRAHYTGQARWLLRYTPAQYTALRALLPPATAVHLVAATAFMHTCDRILDQDSAYPVIERAARFEGYAQRVRDALASSHTPSGSLGPLWHTTRAHPQLAYCVEDFLRAAPIELHFTGFESEADFVSYVNDYTLPALLTMATVLRDPSEPPQRLRERVRLIAVPVQRIDFLTDLAEDLQEGRLCLPLADLQAAGVQPDDLRRQRGTVQVQALLAHTAAKCWTDLAAAKPATAGFPTTNAPMIAAQLDIYAHMLRVAQAHGARLLRHPARPRIPAAAAILLRHHKQARAHTPNHLHGNPPT